MRVDSLTPVDVSGLRTVGLAEVLGRAAQLERVDRKYLVSRGVAQTFLSRMSQDFRVLSIDGRSYTSYTSIYFDTPGLDACRDHVQRRRRRWKVRSRLYVEDRLCRIEVKTKDGRGVTLKAVAPSDPARHGRLDGAEADFVADVLAGRGVGVDVEELQPSMEVDYQRVTLADTERGMRVTLDWGVDCRLDGGRVWVDDNWVLVETKGGNRPSDADRALVSMGARPRPFSKYVSAASLLREEIPDNDVRRLRGRALHAVTTDMDQEKSA
jgi:hypothetical protein